MNRRPAVLPPSFMVFAKTGISEQLRDSDLCPTGVGAVRKVEASR